MDDHKRVTRSQATVDHAADSEAMVDTVDNTGGPRSNLADEIASLINSRIQESESRTSLQIQQLQDQIQTMTDWIGSSGCDGKLPPQIEAATAPAVKPQLAAKPEPAMDQGRSDKRLPQNYDGTGPWNAYFAQFQIIAKQNRWLDNEKATQLAASLQGKALEVLGHLSESQYLDFSFLVSALNQRFGSDHQEEAFRVQFRTRRRRQHEPLPELAQDLERLGYLAYPTIPREYMEIWVRDQFIESLDRADLRLAVQKERPATIREALACALEMESVSIAAASQTQGATGFRSHAVKTHPGTSDEPQLQDIIHRLERIERSQIASNRGARDRGESSHQSLACWNCGEAGHVRRNCRRPDRNNGTRIFGQPQANRNQAASASNQRSGNE